jgi:hypothetical protein
MSSRKAISLAVAAVAVARVAYGQLDYLWTFEELTKKADAIVIAEARQTTEIARTTHPELKPGFPVVESETSFKVLTAFKETEHVGPTIRLKHFSPDWKNIPGGLLNGGGSLTVTAGDDYLLFLSRDGDLYEPVSGQAFPGHSVKHVPHANR